MKKNGIIICVIMMLSVIACMLGSISTVQAKTKVSVQGITLNATSVNTLTIGDTFQLSATIAPADATNQKVTYAVVQSKPLKSTVSTTVLKVGKNTGLVTITGLGTAVVEATTADGAFTARCTFTVYQTYFDVTKLGADGTDTANDNTAINKALKWALAVNEPITVYVPAGTYYINARLYIYSNTKLVLDDKATIVRQASAAGRPMLQSLYKKSATKGYTQFQNVEITGGVWDGNANGTDYTDNFYFGHGKNIYIHDTTVKNNSGSHLIELVGINNAVIDNVTLDGFKVCTKSGYGVSQQTVKEAIQLDYCSKASASVMIPYDDTVCKNITIKNCTISNYMCGIGAHGFKAGVYLKNIVIQNNTFKNITNCCIDLRNFKNVTVKNNTAKGFNSFLYGYNSTGTIKNNKLNNTSFFPITTKYRMYANGIYLSTKSNFTISKNTIKNCGNHGISIASSSVVKIKNNIVKKNKKYGIKVEGATATIKGNTVSGNAYDRQYYSDAKAKITADNIQAYYVSLDAQYQYTGKAIKPKITISGVKKKNYTVTYKKNKKTGTAQVVIKGTGTKKGKLVLNFDIVKKLKN